MKEIICFLFAVGLIGPLCGCMPSGPDTSATPTQAYATMSGSALPDSVSNMECHGAFWIDHNFCMRFNASTSDIQKILDAGYTATEWNLIEDDFQHSPYLEDFAGRWRPEEIKSKSCYKLATEAKDYDQVHLLLIDHDANLVYCVSFGSVKPITKE